MNRMKLSVLNRSHSNVPYTQRHTSNMMPIALISVSYTQETGWQRLTYYGSSNVFLAVLITDNN